MEKVQDDEVKMVNVTSEFILSNKLIWDPNLVLQDLSDELEGSAVYFEVQRQIQIAGSSDETTQKNYDFEQLLGSILKVRNGIHAYCNYSKDFASLHLVEKSESTIIAMKEDDFIAFASIIYDKGIALGVKMLPYNIKPTDLSIMHSRIETAQGSMFKHRQKVALVYAATSNIETELKRITARMRNELDPLIETFVDIAPDFVIKYRVCRTVIHYGVRHLAPEATINLKIVDITTKAPLRLTAIIVNETGDIALTDDAGLATLKVAKAGIYSLKCTKNTYQILTKDNVELGVGDILNLTIELTSNL